MRVKSEKRNLGEEDRVWEHVSRTPPPRSRPAADQRRHLGSRPPAASCSPYPLRLCSNETKPLRPARIERPVPSRRLDAAAHAAARSLLRLPTVRGCHFSLCDQPRRSGSRSPTSRSTLSARAARRRRHSHRNPSSDSSVAPLSIEARAPGRALSALRPGMAVQRITRLAWRTTPRDASPCTPCPNAWRPPPTRGQW
jgi:hypothetical protein